MLDSLFEQEARSPQSKNQSNYESIHEFWNVRLQARWSEALGKLTSKKDHLLDLNCTWKDYLSFRHADAGIQVVPLDRIVGSLGRSEDFDRHFLPRSEKTRSRWITIDRLYHQSVPLPPVQLYQVGDVYYVVDGHHRLSVSRAHGQLFVDAQVIRFEPGDGETPQVC